MIGITSEVLARACRDLVLANRVLANEGVLDAFGHVSIRHPENPGQYIMPRSLSPEQVTESDLLCFTLDGREVTGDTRRGYLERAIHGAVYEARADAHAVCHNHAPSTIPFGVTGTPFRPILHVASLIGVDPPNWDIRDEFGDTDMLVRTMDQGRSLVRALGPRPMALIRGHGTVVVGATVREVVMAAIYMEQNAQLLQRALALGEVRYLSADETEAAGAMLREPVVRDRAWECWTARVTGMAL